MIKIGDSSKTIVKSKKFSSKVAIKTGKKKSTKSSKNNFEDHPTRSRHHPIFHQELTIGQRSADMVAKIGGSWSFVILLCVVFFGWIILNAVFLAKKPSDPYSYILINLFLSVLAAIQAPIILMAQNRQAERDRIDAKYDHQINRKAEREIQAVHKDVGTISRYLRMIKDGK